MSMRRGIVRISMVMRIAWSAVFAVVLMVAAGCNSGSLGDALDVAEGVPRKTIDVSRLAINAFGNDTRFGSTESQYAEVRNVLGLRAVRVLFAWNDGVQPGPSSDPDLSFYAHILDSIPGNVEVLVVTTGVPSWMSNPDTWIDGNPRTTFVERWLKPLTRRFGGNGKIRAWQVWNEPNMVANPDNTTMGFATSPENYVELLARASNVIRDRSPGRLVLPAATTAINQNFPQTIDYNRAMRDAGAQEFVDRWAVHYYGKQFENVIRNGGIEDFLDGLTVNTWVTESGEQGVNNQLAYGEQAWPFLIDQIAKIERIYVYQFTEATPEDVTYGLRNLGPNPLSDLYIHLRERNGGS